MALTIKRRSGFMNIKPPE